MQLNIKTSELFSRTYNSDKRFVIHQGGTRSGKTFSILQVLIIKALEAKKPMTISICRRSFPSLKLSALRDFINILDTMGLYKESDHNKTDATYKLGNCMFDFMSMDDANKKRGTKRDILYLNEANELTFEDFFQLQIRTEQQVILDYNPSDNQSWIYDLIEERPEEIDFIKSTFLDNPFLPEDTIKEIQNLKYTDDDYYRIYALGERGSGRTLIFQYQQVKEINYYNTKFVGIGMDFGYSNDPTTMVEVWKDDFNNLYIKELCYKTKMTNSDIMNELVKLEVAPHTLIVADSAEPKSIEELRRAGFNIKPTKKGKDSINVGIDFLKRHKLFVTEDSVNLIKEFNNYKWKMDRSGQMTNQPIDAFNHAIDALRYIGTYTQSKSGTGVYHFKVVEYGSTY
jgi:phage terminase large subunit